MSRENNKNPLSIYLITLLFSLSCHAQAPTDKTKPSTSSAVAPATKMEAFQPGAGSVVTFGYDNLGTFRGISVDARQISESNGSSAKGLLVEISQGEYRKERAFVDADEIPELLSGFNALLRVDANPTQFKNFEVRYKTKGGLELTAFNEGGGHIAYAVQAGQISKAQSLGLNQKEMEKLKSMFEAAQQKLSSVTLNSTKTPTTNP